MLIASPKAISSDEICSIPSILKLLIYGGVLKVYRTSFPRGERRFSRSQIEALLKGRKLG
jgi:hypothetical protein